MSDFVHLHLHTQYSFLDGAIRMPELCPRIAELGMDACAVTDHGNLFGAVDFYRRARSAGIKPILGCEVYVAEHGRFDRSARSSFHLVLLARNRKGWKNLMYLVSMGYQEGFYYTPRIDKALLRDHAEGLIGLTACLGGEVPKKALTGDLDGARLALREYRGMFEPDSLFVELQENGRNDQSIANAHLMQLARDEGVGLIATNDCHYKLREDAAAHDVLMAIQYGKARDDPTRRGRGSDQFYVRSPEEMKSLFQGCPEAIENTARVRDLIDLDLELGRPMLPTFVPPDGSDLDDYLASRAMRGLEERFLELSYAVDRDAYHARLRLELDIIVGMKFPGYFLIVADFINWAKTHDIPVGPGRGSGAGSLVAYALRITDLDPLPYNLLFERFLNPERVSMPDFDVDFCQERRGDVIRYVTEQYGASRVGQIATFAQMKAKSVIKDVSRALEVPFSEINALTKLLPATYKDDKGNVKPITIQKALELEPKLKALQQEKPLYREILEIALKLEGLYRQAGMHAAGVVIADSDLWEHVPIFRGSDGEIVTQFSMADVEDAGLVKFDFLGLKTLDVIHHAERHVNARIQSEVEAGELGALLRHPHLARRFKDVQGLGVVLARALEVPGTLDSDVSTRPSEDALQPEAPSVGAVSEGMFGPGPGAVSSPGLVPGLEAGSPPVSTPSLALGSTSSIAAGSAPGSALGSAPGMAAGSAPGSSVAAVAESFQLRCALLPLDDREVFRLIGRGETLGVFQLESTGFQELLRRLKPDCFEDIVAAVALYRPGPLQTGMVDDFIDCKHGRQRVKYPHPLLEEVLKPTYGGFVYQEQVMQAAQVMAGYSLGGADLLRRAMGKKKPEVMAKERAKFTTGCRERGIGERQATEVFDLMEKFAGYGFNKSHSAAYALITFQTAYLKTYYPVEFMAALLTTEAGSTENIVKYIGEARSMGIAVLPPTVNDSEISFAVQGGKIRFGLGAIKGLGAAALSAILDARRLGGPFLSLYDFCERVSLRILNKKTLETLVRSGAFDGFGRPRAQVLEAIDRAIAAARSTQQATEVGQGSLFGAPGLAEFVKPREIYDDSMGEWPELERLRYEKDAIGFYVTGHPLDRYLEDLRRLGTTTIAELERKEERGEVVLGCVVSALRERPLRDGSGRMAFVTVEDHTGAIEMLASAKVFGQIEPALKADAPLLVQAAVSLDRDEEGNSQLRIRCLGAKNLAEARSARAQAVVVTLHAKAVELEALRRVLESFAGPCPVRITVPLELGEVDLDLPASLAVEPNDKLVDRVERITGRGTVRFA